MGLLWRMTLGSIRDLTPVVVVILFFQIVVLQQPASQLLGLIEGALLVLFGLILFVYGLELALFPIGDALANALAERGSFILLLVFAFLLGFGTTFAEPALTAVAAQAADAAAAGGAIASTDVAKDGYAFGLRLTVALSVGVALLLGVTRIVLGWSLPLMIICGYILVIAIATIAPPETIGIAFDAGGVTTSVITVPLVTALGIGLASSLAERNPMTDGFGMIVLVLLTPMIFVMAYGTLLAWI
ncbi:MAG TPA: DUF1538 domain-containing protein [Woeseiaceae bacterium]|nr:DUF1538 domain-containing protein [Woeseiaceae bacterium]